MLLAVVRVCLILCDQRCPYSEGVALSRAGVWGGVQMWAAVNTDLKAEKRQKGVLKRAGRTVSLYTSERNLGVH